MRTIPAHLLPSKLLVVDDNQANVDLLEMVLSFAGFTSIDTTTDPTVVPDQQRTNRYDLILSDLRMPILDGFGLLRILREEYCTAELPILVITAQTDSESRLKALELGATDFLHKPFDQSEVLNRVVNMLTTRHLYKLQVDANIELERKVMERTRELHEITCYVITSLGRAAEFRDNETGLHVVRMSNYCALMARAMGCDEGYTEMLRQASTMHDVGKIGIPDGILLKPARLTHDEFQIMQEHPVIGGKIIGEHSSGMLAMARVIALTHHEKWDGSGYPAGLKAEDIPIEGRIVAICDVFDALTSERPYKKAWSVEETILHMQKSAGTHFDPTLINVFCSIIDQVLVIKNQYQEPDEDALLSPLQALSMRV